MDSLATIDVRYIYTVVTQKLKQRYTGSGICAPLRHSPAIDMLPLYHGHNSDSKSAHQIARLRLRRRIVLCVGFLSCVWLFVQLWSDPPPPNFPKYPPPGPASVWTERAGRVRQAYIHAYSGYLKQAAPYDELLPVSGGKLNTYVSQIDL
jgi:hypothetical protein